MDMKWKTAQGLSLGKLSLGLGKGHAYAVSSTIFGTATGTALVIAGGVLIVGGLIALAKRRRKKAKS